MWLIESKIYRNFKKAICIITYLPVFIVILDTINITHGQFKRRISHVPNLIRGVTALTCDVWINSFKLNTTLPNLRLNYSRKFDLCISQFQLRPAPPPLPPGLPQGICPPCKSQGWGISKFCAARGPGICQPRGQTRTFNMHAVSYQHITTQRILLEKQADRLICQGRKKIEEVCKGMFSIYKCISSLLIT